MGALCKQRVVLKSATLVGLVHVTVDAAHAISGNSDADVDPCSNCRVNAAAQRRAVLARDNGEWQTRDVAAGACERQRAASGRMAFEWMEGESRGAR
jgi:hypothetical protein